jgi:hypothetical protein
MKKTFLLNLLILFTSINANAQDFLIFKVRYKPQTKYYQTFTINSKSSNTFSGSEEVLKRLNEKGVKNPTTTTRFIDSESITMTGKLNSKNFFPVTMEYVKAQKLNGEEIVPQGTLVYGKGTLDNMPVLDSVASNTINAEFKKFYLKSLNDLMSQITYPIKKLKIGESFIHENPLSMPGSKENLEMIIKTEYKLVSIKNNLGYFDIKQVYSMKSEISQKDFKGKGTGTGTMVYDIQNNFFQKYNLKNETEMDFSMNGLQLNIKSETETLQDIKISKN